MSAEIPHELKRIQRLIMYGVFGLVVTYLLGKFFYPEIYDPWVLKVLSILLLSASGILAGDFKIGSFQVSRKTFQIFTGGVGIILLSHTYWLAYMNRWSTFSILVCLCMSLGILSILNHRGFIFFFTGLSVSFSLIGFLVKEPLNPPIMTSVFLVAATIIASAGSLGQIEAFRYLKSTSEDQTKILSHLHLGVLLFSKEGKVVSYNKAAKDYLEFLPNGIGPNLFTGHGLTIFNGDQLIQQNELPHLKARVTGEPQTESQLQILVEKLPARWLSISAIPLQAEGGPPFSVLLVVRDITTEKDLQLWKENQKAFLSATSKMTALGEMTAGIAHEINNPLAIISGKANHLQKLMQSPTINKEKIDENLQKIQKTVTRIAKIIQSMRSIARENDKDPFESVSVQKLIDDTLILCQDELTHHQIEVILDIDTQHAIECRPGQICQVLMNLLNNARDAVKDSQTRWIKIASEIHEHSIQIKVSDSGPGIPAEYRQKIMQPFFSTKDAKSGTGLGLSISFRIAQSHNGHLTLAPSIRPTMFILEIPMVQGAQMPTDKIIAHS